MEAIFETDITLNLDFTKLCEQLKPSVKKIRPDWKTEDIIINAIVGGKINRVFTISVPDHPDDILAVRVFGEAGIAMMDHEVEYMIVKHLTQNTELVKIYGKFTNGYMYKYIPGRIFTTEDLQDEFLRRKLCQRFHEVHAVKLSSDQHGSDVVHYDANLGCMDFALRVIRSEKASILDEDERILSEGLSHSSLLVLAEETKREYLEIKESHPTVFCHGDAQVTNIIVDEKDNVNLIDWDCMSVSHEIIDLALLLSRDSGRSIQDAKMMPFDQEDLMDKWLMTYLETHPQYQDQAVGQDIFKEWKILLVKMFEVTSKWLACCALAAALSCSDNKFDGFEVLQEYMGDAQKYTNMLKQLKDEK